MTSDDKVLQSIDEIPATNDIISIQKICDSLIDEDKFQEKVRIPANLL